LPHQFGTIVVKFDLTVKPGIQRKSVTSSIGHPPHSSASPVELRLRVGPYALNGKKYLTLSRRQLQKKIGDFYKKMALARLPPTYGSGVSVQKTILHTHATS
jgi:hypothetical protein